MGFTTLIDIIGSSIIGGFLLIILLQLNGKSTENTFTYSGELTVQQNLVTVVQILEYDFRKIGYCADFKKIPKPHEAILFADSNSIKFLTDVEPSDGTIDTMTYSLGPASELSGTPNPRDRMLYRIINSEIPKEANLGVTEFKITYYNTLGHQLSFPVASPEEVYTLQIDVMVENPVAYDNKYSNAFWRQIRLAARNIRNR